MRLTQSDIQAKREELRQKHVIAMGEVEKIRAEMRTLQVICKHPAQRQISCMGELSMYCPDCEWGS